jgi:HSP20 family protein
MDDAITWVPSMDIYEIDDNYILNAELPGVESRDIRIEFSGLEFTIRGERRLDTACAEESYHRLEGHRGRFHRTFSLPEPVDSSRIQLELKEGVLHVVLPKSSGSRAPSPRGNC